MVMITLKIVACIKEVLKVTYYFLAGCLYGKNTGEPESGIIYLCVYIKSVPSCQNRYMIKTLNHLFITTR